jgi:5-oxoprolinase (ATP-hydrolysing)
VSSSSSLLILLPPAHAFLPSHLPDITIISPVFDDEEKDIIFFTASRGHHADIGGILPGSMPPTSTSIFEEGAHIVSFKIVHEGIFDRDSLVKYMIDEPAKYPGSSGCRNIRDVESDLKAVSGRHALCAMLVIYFIFVANCRKPQGHPTNQSQYVEHLFFVSRANIRNAVVDDYGLKTVQEYMYHIRNNAETSVRNLLKDVTKRAGTNVLSSIDYLDDGSPVNTGILIHIASADESVVRSN